MDLAKRLNRIREDNFSEFGFDEFVTERTNIYGLVSFCRLATYIAFNPKELGGMDDERLKEVMRGRMIDGLIHIDDLVEEKLEKLGYEREQKCGIAKDV